MALSIPFHGSGRFVPERVWSCPVHDDNVTDRGEDWDGGWDDPWETEGEVCLDCVTGQWLNKKDEKGEVIMRELGAWEAMLLDNAAEMFNTPTLLAEMLTRHDSHSPMPLIKYHWCEDDLPSTAAP